MPGCRCALIAHRVSNGESPCSAETGAYCQARKRLPETFVAQVARQSGAALEAEVHSAWLWKGRRVLVYDGSSVSMPDTPQNQRDYPQPDTQKPGLGFPHARIAAVFSLACGAILDLETVAMQVRGKAIWGCCERYCTSFSPVMSCWRIASCAHGQRW